MRQSICLGAKQWRSELKTADFWVVMLCLFTFMSINFYDSGSLLYEQGGKIGIFSLFPIVMTDADFILIIFAGLLMVLCDIPMRKAGLTFEVLRMNRLTWFLGQVMYSFFMCATYFILVYLSTIVFYVRNLEWTTAWGKAVEDGTAFMGSLGMLFPSEILKLNALATFLRAFLLAVLLGVFLSMVCCVANMLGGKGIGLALCGMLIILQRLFAGYLIDLGMFSPVGMLNCFYQDIGTNLIPAICYYVFITTLLIAISNRILYKTDISENE
jgi:hypothetical protein